MKIEPTDKAMHVAAIHDGQVYLAQVIEPGQAIAAPSLVGSEDENEFLGAVAGKAGDYNPLPQPGEWCEAGEIYGYNGGLVKCRQSHYRTEHDPEDVPALWSVYRPEGGVLEWVANEPVTVGTRRTYDGVLYECIQSHTTQTDWQPDRTPALWRELITAPQTGAWAVGVSYKIGDRVIYNGATYECIQAHTSQAGWTPAAVPALWRKL